MTMDLEERLKLLGAAQAEPALLALASVDLTHARLREAERALLRDALLAASLPHWFDAQILAAQLGIPLQDCAKLVEQLSALSIVEPFTARGRDAYNVHEASRLALREHVRLSMPEKWRHWSERVHAHLGTRADFVGRIEALFHQFAFDPDGAAKECEQLDRAVCDLARLEHRYLLSSTLREVVAAGWLVGSNALAESRMSILELRNWRGEAAQLEREALAVAQLADTTGAAWTIARSRSLLGDVFQAQGRLDDAMAAFGETLAILQRLTRTDPSNTSWQRWLGAVHTRVGDIFQLQGRLDDAMAAFGETLAISQRLASVKPSSVSWQRDLGVAHSRVGDIFEAQGRLDDAMAALGHTLTIFKSLASTDPSNADWQSNFGLAHGRVGDILQAQDRLDDAMASYEAGLAIAERMARTDPSNADWQRNLAGAHSRVGNVFRAQGRLDDAMTSYEAGLAIARRMAGTDASNANWQRDLGVAHSRVGDIFEAQGRLDDAMAAFGEALAILQRLARIDPSNADWQCELGSAHTRVGDIFQGQGRLDDAMAAFGETLAISQRLARTDPSNADWQHRLAIAAWWVGSLSRRQQRHAEAVAAFQAAESSLAAAVSLAPKMTLWAEELDSLRRDSTRPAG